MRSFLLLIFLFTENTCIASIYDRIGLVGTIIGEEQYQSIAVLYDRKTNKKSFLRTGGFLLKTYQLIEISHGKVLLKNKKSNIILSSNELHGAPVGALGKREHTTETRYLTEYTGADVASLLGESGSVPEGAEPFLGEADDAEDVVSEKRPANDQIKYSFQSSL